MSTAYNIEGNGPNVVLVHGLGLNRHMWQWQMDALVLNFTVITYDLLGHGESDKPEGPYLMEHMVDQLAQLMNTLGIQQSGLIGFSLGGLIVQAFTLAHPELVSALVILNAGHQRTEKQRAAIMQRVKQVTDEGPAATVPAALDRWFSPEFSASNPDVLERVADWILANDPSVYPELYKLLATGDIGLEQSIAAIRCPTLVITGEDDFGNAPEMAHRIARIIPDAQCEILPGLRHMALAENPVAVNTLLASFLCENMG